MHQLLNSLNFGGPDLAASLCERRAMRWTARELNRADAPKDHRSTTSQWHHQYLVRILNNTKYNGIWP